MRQLLEEGTLHMSCYSLDIKPNEHKPRTDNSHVCFGLMPSLALLELWLLFVMEAGVDRACKDAYCIDLQY